MNIKLLCAKSSNKILEKRKTDKMYGTFLRFSVSIQYPFFKQENHVSLFVT